jgi:MFS family permease
MTSRATTGLAAVTPWRLLIAHTVLVQTVTFLLRPATSYRALELGVTPAWLGVVSASFAVVPLLLALVVGRWTDRRGEGPILVTGAVLVLLSAAGFALLGGSVPALVAWSAVLGMGHLLSMVGGQSLAARLAPPEEHDTAFGHYTFAASFGQAIGPGLVALLGGGGTDPDTTRLFAGAVVVGVVFLGIAFTLRRWRAGAHHAAAAGGLRAALRVPGLSRAILASLTVLAATDLLVVYLPALGQERGIAAAAIGILLGLRAAASMTTRFFLGALVRRLGRERLLIGGIAVSALGMALLPVPMPLAALGVVVVIVGLALGVGQPLTLAWVTQAAPAPIRATAIGLRLTGNRLGQVLIPSGVGLVASAAGVAGVLWATAGALALVAAVSAAGGRFREQAADPADEPDTDF